MAVKNQVQLITYPDSLGGDLKTLNQVLTTYFPNTFKGGIHILPPFPSSGDRGFAPLTYFEIEPKFGTWEDIRKIGEKHDDGKGGSMWIPPLNVFGKYVVST